MRSRPSSLQVPLLVARYAGKFELTIKVRDAVRAHQSSADSINLGIAMAKILERVVLGCTILVSSLYKGIFCFSHARPDCYRATGRESNYSHLRSKGCKIEVLRCCRNPHAISSVFQVSAAGKPSYLSLMASSPTFGSQATAKFSEPLDEHRGNTERLSTL